MIEDENNPLGRLREQNEVVPERIGHYTIYDELGRGGQGTVFRAEDQRLHRQVALKVINAAPGSLARKRLLRFKREAEAASKIDHPNICAIHEAGEVDGSPYIAMRLISGEPLARRIAQAQSEDKAGHTPSSQSDINEITHLIEKVGRALHCAHEHGLIHRDIKPGNIMVSPEGEPMILDFGLARDELADQQTLTHSGDLLGTPAYMSPEQLLAQRIPLDRRTDVYSLGATLYECLTLQRPFEAATQAELYQKIISAEPSTATSLNRQIPRDLQVVLATAMAKDRNRRYQTALDFAEDLRRVREFEPIRAKPIGRMLRLKRWSQRHPAASVTIAALATLLLVTLGFLWEQADKTALERRLREQGIRTAALLAARSVAIEVELRWRILESAAARPELHQALIESEDPGSMGRLQEWLEAQYSKNSDATKAVSWFIMGRDGTQLARAPFSERSVGENWSFRDYFHGQGRDLEPTEAEDLRPIRDVHRSSVFRSTVTENLMVAFSVPIWAVSIRAESASTDSGADVVGVTEASLSRAANSVQVVGVLSMTVELGRFGVLQIGLQKNQVAALVDTRQDWSGRPGLFLHHARLAELRLKQRRTNGGELPSWYAPGSLVEQFVNLRQGRLEQERRRVNMPWEEQLLMVEEPGLETLETDYQDPVNQGSDDRWLAGFEPVLISGRSEPIRDTAWIVVVQERRRP